MLSWSADDWKDFDAVFLADARNQDVFAELQRDVATVLMGHEVSLHARTHRSTSVNACRRPRGSCTGRHPQERRIRSKAVPRSSLALPAMAWTRKQKRDCE